MDDAAGSRCWRALLVLPFALDPELKRYLTRIFSNSFSE